MSVQRWFTTPQGTSIDTYHAAPSEVGCSEGQEFISYHGASHSSDPFDAVLFFPVYNEEDIVGWESGDEFPVTDPALSNVLFAHWREWEATVS